MKRTLSTLVVLALVATACGDDDSGLPPTGPDGPSASTTTAPVGPGPTAPVTLAPSTTVTAPSPLLGLDVETIARGLDNPVFVASLPGEDRLFVVEKAGEVVIVTADGVLEDPFLDIEDRVESSHLEQGLLGMAFHPEFADNRRFFVYYTDLNGASTISEFSVSADPNLADVTSERILLSQPQPQGDHNAGMLEFGPDGYLWASIGDGGGPGDPFDTSQDPGVLLGTIIRIDVDAERPYASPPDNPFVSGGGRPEVWSFGLRNPWRFSIDDVSGMIYVADVGQGGFEEVSVVSALESGFNFGWSIMEGSECFRADSCDQTGLVLPVVDYSHDQGCSITGGVVYRGAAIPELWGHYFYGDWCGQWVRTFRLEDGVAVDQVDWTGDLGTLGHIQSFGESGDGEVHLVTADGFLYRIVPRR